MNLILEVNASTPTDIAEAIELLERIQAGLQTVNDPDLAKAVGAVADLKRYGKGRLGYLADVAAAGDAGADVAKLMADHFGGSHHAFGGTHSSIEKTWRANGGQAFATKLIDNSPDRARQVMFAAARELVLVCIGASGDP